MARNYLIAGKSAWDQGNFNYDSTIDFSDAQVLQKNYNVVASGSLVGSTAEAVNAGLGGLGSGVTSGSGAATTTTGGGSSGNHTVDVEAGTGHRQKRHGKRRR